MPARLDYIDTRHHFIQFRDAWNHLHVRATDEG